MEGVGVGWSRKRKEGGGGVRRMEKEDEEETDAVGEVKAGEEPREEEEKEEEESGLKKKLRKQPGFNWAINEEKMKSRNKKVKENQGSEREEGKRGEIKRKGKSEGEVMRDEREIRKK